MADLYKGTSGNRVDLMQICTCIFKIKLPSVSFLCLFIIMYFSHDVKMGISTGTCYFLFMSTNSRAVFLVACLCDIEEDVDVNVWVCLWCT